MAKHFDLNITDDRFTFARNSVKIDAEAALDGVYVVRTSFIPSFFEIKESAGREFFPKRIGGVFFEACADCHIECSRRTTRISPIRGGR
jgi:hypothetical protein